MRQHGHKRQMAYIDFVRLEEKKKANILSFHCGKRKKWEICCYAVDPMINDNYRYVLESNLTWYHIRRDA